MVCPDHVSQPKPNPEPLLLNCRQLGCAVDQAIYVGDHRRDIEAGRAAGIYTIAAGYGYVHHEEDPSDWGADSLAERSEELTALIADAL